MDAGRLISAVNETFFLDSNILVYLFDRDAPDKRRYVHELIASHASQGRLIISTQVLQEFYSVVTRKLAHPLFPEHALKAVQDFSVWPVIQVDVPLILSGIVRHQTDKLSFWDSLIVEAALTANVRELYSEDMHDGRVINGMRITNPFKTRSRI